MIERHDETQEGHVYKFPNEEVIAMVLSSPVYVCPNCGHGIDPHGVDPGGVCGVGDSKRNLCQCLLTPNAIAHYFYREGQLLGTDHHR